jgi:sugar phosphate isomerase/epimerase
MIGGLLRKGNVEEFEFWSSHNVDFMMLSVAYDFFLDGDKFSRVLNLKDKFGLNLLFHPRPDGQTFQTPANLESHRLMFESLERIREAIQQYGLINKVILHLATYKIPDGYYYTFSEDDAIGNSLSFYRELREFNDLTFALENVYPPGIGWEELGYEKEHYGMFDIPENFEFCLDTGHLNLSMLEVNDILDLPFKITCLHLHSNDGKSDQHVPLNRRNFANWEDIERLLSNDKYIVMEVKNKLEEVGLASKYLRQNKIAP